MRGLVAIGCLGAALSSPACGDEPSLIDGRFTVAEWDKIERFSPLGAPPPVPTNKYADDPRAAHLGQRLWFESRYSGPLMVDDPDGLGPLGAEGRVSCFSCHDNKQWWIDTRGDNAVSLGAYRARRNSPSMVNVAYYTWGGWGGAQDQFWKQGANAPESRDLNGDRLALAHTVYLYHRAEYEVVFGPLDPALDPAASDAARFPPRGKPKAAPGDPDGPWELMTKEDQKIVMTIQANVGKAFEAYERRLVSRDAPFDRYVAGDLAAISASAKRGLQLFIGKAACDACHSDHTFTDNDFHNTGVPQTVVPPDDGRFADVPRLTNPYNGAGEFSDDPVAGAEKIAGIVQREEQKGQFRTKSLRHVADSGPYFHDGSFTTLEDVIRFYNGGGGETGFPGVKDPLVVPLNLTEAEIADLAAFLRSLTGDPPPPELLEDPT